MSDIDEVDAFDRQRSQILLDQAGEYARGNDDSDMSDGEEEVLGFKDLNDGDEDEDEEEDEDGDEDEEDDGDEDEDEDEGEGPAAWGLAYGGNDADGAEEAIKQQKRHLEDLEMDDYVDEEVEEEWKKAKENIEKEQTVFTLNDAAELDEQDRQKMLKQMFPEFVPLVKEMAQLHPQLEQLEALEQNELIGAKVVALRSYLAAVSLYFALFVDNLEKGESFTTMKDLPVMEVILQSREVWRQALELPNEGEAIEVEDEEMDVEVEGEGVEGEDEDEQIEEDSEDEEVSEDEEASELSDATPEPFTIDTTAKRLVPKIDKYATTVDDEDKQRRKKTLRFYTAKIDKTQRKKNDAGDVGGDYDLPYKEREFERRQRLVEEARKRGLGGGDLGNDNDEEAPVVEQGNDDYYNEITAQKAAKKQARIDSHHAAKAAMKAGKLAEVMEDLGEDGKRAVNYQILKNKGLTPHRKKEFRNARVKKRMQYDKAQKKLKSTRAVYNADAAKGPYEGEKTGIKKNLSRSVKLV